MDRPLQYHESTLQENELELVNVSCSNVGYYYCVNGPINSEANLEKLVENGQASKIYLFVEGSIYFILDKTPKIK